MDHEVLTPFTVAWDRTREIGLSLAAALPSLLAALVVYGLFSLVGQLVRAGIRQGLLRTGQPEHVALIFGRLARWAVLTLGVLVALTITFPSLTAASLLSTLGIGGVAIGFAFRDIFTNLLSGLLLLLTRPFRIGDQIVAGTAEGTVEDIQMRATVVRTADHRQILIPNAELFTGRVQVNTAYPLARASFNLLVPHSSDPAAALSVVSRTLHALDLIEQQPPPGVIATEIRGEGVVLSVRYWVRPPEQGELAQTTSAVMLAVNEALRDADISLSAAPAPPAATPPAAAMLPASSSSQR